MKRNIFLFAAILLFPSLLFAQVTGKIKGKITDAKTNEAIIGANIIILGTTMGNVTNIDGDYVILNVPAGNYTLKSSYIGYSTTQISNVQVMAGKTVEQNFKLEAEGVEVKTVEIVGTRPLIDKDQSNTSRYATQEEIKNLPTRGVAAAVALVPGVNFQDERGVQRLYIRGGRADEVGFFVEGASVRNVVSGNQITTVIPEALEEFQVQSGGFGAEFGGANSGIVRQTLRSGSNQYKGSLQIETDNFTDQNKEALGTYSYGYSNMVGTFGGPLWGDHLKFFVAGENSFQRDTGVVFWDGFNLSGLVDDGSAGGTLGDTIPTISLKPGNIPGVFTNRYTGNGTITWDSYPFTVRFGGTFTWQQNKDNGSPIRRVFNSRRPGYTDLSSALGSVKFSHFLDKNTFYEINVNYSDYREKRYDPIFEDEYVKYNDSLENVRYGITNFQNYTLSSPQYSVYGYVFDYPGRPVSAYRKQKQSYYGGSLDFIKQIGTEHEIKVGASVQYYTVRNYSSVSTRGALNFFRNNPDIARTAGEERDLQFRRQAGNINAYGYDVYGNEIDDGVDGPKHPMFAGIYAQDKIEFADLTVTAGARVDITDMDDRRIKDPKNPLVDPGTYNLLPEGLEKVPAYVTVSPRLGFSFPVTERTVFHLQYGKYVQAPQLSVIYSGRGRSALIFGGGNFVSDPIGYGIEPQRTTSYEIGFNQQISDFAKFDITGFYKDISGQIQVDRVSTSATALVSAYNVYTNGDFATTKGLEFSLTVRRTHRMQTTVNYTLSDAQGTGSLNNSAISSVENGDVRPTVISPLSFTQAHRGSINLDYRFEKGDGGPIMENFGANVLFTFNSGHPYTLSTGSIGQRGPNEGGILADDDPRQRSPIESIGNSTTPWNFNFDLKLNKTVDIMGYNVDFFVSVLNLLNTKNVVNVYSRTGSAYDDGYLTNPDLSGLTVRALGQKYVETYGKISLQHRLHYFDNQGGDLFSSPRQIRFGMRLEF